MSFTFSPPFITGAGDRGYGSVALGQTLAQSQQAVADWVEQSLQLFFNRIEAQEQQEGRATMVAMNHDGASEMVSDKTNSRKITTASLMAGARYACLNHGHPIAAKRWRPWLMLVAGQALGVPLPRLMNLSLAVELIHCYSLVHDDLPAMDDDAIRRGSPTLHRAFLDLMPQHHADGGDMANGSKRRRQQDEAGKAKHNEAFAILVGDMLQSLAFIMVAEDDRHGHGHGLDAVAKNNAIAALARAARLMVLGQWHDMAGAEGVDDLLLLQRRKTGALIELCLTAPLLVGQKEWPASEMARWRELAVLLGVFYQQVDDMMDEVGEAQAMGKETQKDRQQGKSTMVYFLGPLGGRRRLDSLAGRLLAMLLAIKTTLLANQGCRDKDNNKADDKEDKLRAIDLLVAWVERHMEKARPSKK